MPKITKQLSNYEIRVRGPAGENWPDWFSGVSVRPVLDPAGQVLESILTLSALDPAGLHGILAQIGSLGLELLSVRILE